MEHVSISTGCGNARNKRILQHITGSSGVLTHHDPRTVTGVGATTECGRIIPAQETAYLVGVHGCKVHICFSSEAICSKIFIAGFLFRGNRQIILQKSICRNSKKLAKLQYLIDLRKSLVHFPFRYGLTGYRNLLRQFFLRNACHCPQLIDLFTDGHR